MPTQEGQQATPDVVNVKIPPIEVGRFSIVLVGDSELISHRWSEKAKKEMLDKQMGKPKQAKAKKDPWMDYCESLYWLSKMPAKPKQQHITKAAFGFPSVAFKKSAVGGCRSADGIKMTEARAAFHVEGELVEIAGRPGMREDMVRLQGSTADIRYRGGFFPWSVTVHVSYNTRFLTAEQIVNLFNLGGFGVGIGEWRPEKNGQYGRFHVATSGEEQSLGNGGSSRRTL